jgi:NAD(P)-dependent dehydrogenase (short-subunit alcohol dehydrogenase family)
MSGRLDGKVAVVTGGASGMGRATVLRFLQEGARVVIADMNEQSGAETMSLVAAQGNGENAEFIRTNVAEEADIEAAVGLAVDKFGRLDTIFNNAGIGGAFGPVTELTVDEWDFTFDVLVRGVFLGTKHAVRQIKKQGGGGTVINTASVAGLGGGAGPTAYSAAKAAVVNLTKALAGELSHHGVRINAIAPGAIRTPLFHGHRPDRTEARAQARTPWPRLGEGEDIANAALYLASDESGFVTGHILVVDGGALAQGPDFWGHGDDSPFLRKVGVNKGSTGEPAAIRDLAESDD